MREYKTNPTQSVPCPVKTKSPSPPCGKHSRVLRTTKTSSGEVVRQRVCARGHRFTTTEKPK